MSTRIGQLQQLSCKVFSNVYNPTCARTGNKVLRQRLLGPTLTAYNPKQMVHFRDIQALYPQLGLVDLEEKERLDEIARRKRRGKGAPKKGKDEEVLELFIYSCFFKVKESVQQTRRNKEGCYIYTYKKNRFTVIFSFFVNWTR